MHDWSRYLIEKERRRDEIRRADAHRSANVLLRQTSLDEEQPLRRYEFMLAALGDRLVVWGCRLQKRYRRLALTTNCSSTESRLAQQQAESPCCA